MIRFLRWYSFADLYEPSALVTTRAITVSVALATAGAVVALAIPWLVGEVRKTRQAADPLKSCLWVTDPSSRVGDKPMTTEKITAIADALKLEVGERFKNLVGFAEIKAEFVNSQNGKLSYRTLTGRTITANDPLNLSLDKLISSGQSFSREQPTGILVTRKLLKELGNSPEEISNIEASTKTANPFQLKWLAPSQQSVPIAIRGVFAEPLPLGHDFIIPEAQEVQLRSQTLFKTDDIILYPIGIGWPIPKNGKSLNEFINEGFDIDQDDPECPYHSKLPVEVRNTLRDWNCRIKLISYQDSYAWRMIRLPDTGGREVLFTDSTWKEHVNQLKLQMERAGLGGASKLEISPADPRKAMLSEVTAPPHDWATVYVNDLYALRPVAQVFRQLNLECDESAIRQLEQIENDVRDLRRILYALVCLFALSVASSVYYLGRLRARLKAPEIGMLRAMGISDRRLRAITMSEAGLLWVDGTSKGIVFAVIMLTGLLVSAGVTREEFMSLNGWFQHFVGQACFLLSTFLFCQGGTLRAVNQVARLSPIEGLNQSA